MLLKENTEDPGLQASANPSNPQEVSSPGRNKLKKWLNRNFRIEMIDGRTLIGLFLCTDRDANIILGMCTEYSQNSSNERNLGLAIIAKRNIRKIEVDTGHDINEELIT